MYVTTPVLTPYKGEMIPIQQMQSTVAIRLRL